MMLDEAVLRDVDVAAGDPPGNGKIMESVI